MVARADILAGRAVILVNIQDTVEAQLRGIRSKLRMFTNSFSDLGSNLFRGGAVGSFASYFPIKEFVEFQDQLLFLQTKLQVTDEAMVPLEKRIRDLGMTTSFSSAEVAKAATMFAQAGFSITETSDALQAALDLARGGQIDISTSTTILANSIRTFGAEANQAAEYASKFIAAARLGTLDLVDLGQSLTYSSGTFANLGVDIEYVLGLITNLSKSGLKASLAGTSLNTAFLNLAGSADKLQESLGIALTDEDFDNPILGLTKIQKALDKFPKLQQLSIVQDLVNIRGGRAIFGTFLQGLDSLQKTTDEIRNSADEARIASVKLDSRLGGVGRRALSAFQELNIAIGSTAEGPLTMLGESMAAFLNDLSQLSAKFPKFTQALLLAGPAALIAGAGLLSLTFITGKIAALITPVLMLNAAIFKLGTGLVGLNVGVLKDSASALSRPFVMATSAAQKHYKAIAANEARITKLAASYANRPTVGGFRRIIQANNAGARLQQGNLLTRTFYARNIPGTVTAGFTRIATIGTRIGTTFSRVGSVLSNTFTKALPVINKIGSALQRVHNFLLLPRATALTAISGFFKSLNIGTVVTALTKVNTLFTLLTVKSLNVLPGIFGAMRTGIVGLARGIGNVNWLGAFVTGFRSLLTVGKGLFTILNGIRRVVFSFSGFLTILELLILFGDRIPGIKDVLAGAGAAISGLFSNIGKTLADTLPAFKVLGQGIKSIFTGDAENGVMKITMALKNMTAVVQTGLSAAWKQFVADIQPAIDLVHNLWIGISNVGSALIEVLSSNLGLVFKTGKILIGADGSLAATIAAAFSPENLQGFFAAIIAIIGEIGKFINTIIGAVAEVLNLIKQGFIGILQLLTLVKGTDAAAGASAALDAADQNSPARRALELKRIGIINNAELAQQGASPEEARLIGIRARFEASQLQKQIDALGPVFGTIAHSVEESNAAIDAAMSRFIGNLNAMSDAMNPSPETTAPGTIPGLPIDFSGLMTDTPFAGLAALGKAGLNSQDGRWDYVNEQEEGLDSRLLQMGAKTTDSPLAEGLRALAAETEGNLIKEYADAVTRIGYHDGPLTQQLLDDKSFVNNLEKSILGEKYDERNAEFQRNNMQWNGRWQEEQDLTEMGNTFLDSLGKFETGDIIPGIKDIWSQTKEGFMNGFNTGGEGAVAPQREQLQKYSDIVGKSITGSFGSTRGNQLQAVSTTQRLQEKANAKLGEIATSTAKLLEKPGALWS